MADAGGEAFNQSQMASARLRGLFRLVLSECLSQISVEMAEPERWLNQLSPIIALLAPMGCTLMRESAEQLSVNRYNGSAGCPLCEGFIEPKP